MAAASAAPKKAGGKVSTTNPFGMADKSSVDAVIFDGGYGTDYVTFAASLMQKNHAGSTVKVSPTTKIATELQPRFVGGNPPDLIDNSGADAIGFSTILEQLEDLKDVLDANNLEGTKIRDTLFGGVEEPGTYDGKLAALNYVLTVYAVWYSASLFEDERLDPAEDVGRGNGSGRQGQGEEQVPVPVGQGGGDVLPDPGDRVGDQGRRRRGPARAGEPGSEVLVAAGRAGRPQGHGRRSSRPAT